MAKNTTDRENSRRAQIVAAVWSVYSELAQIEGEIETHQKEEIRLVGVDSKLDSFGFVNFLLDVEQQVNDQFGVSIRLMDERALSLNESPFRTVQSLTDFIDTLIG